MSDEAALLAAIAAHPDEDTPRLVYADWLDENDRPIRAEFIRVQCAVKQIESRPAKEQLEHLHLIKRQQFLLENHRRDILGPVGVHLTYFNVVFDRGFASELNVTALLFLQCASAIGELRPIPRIRVNTAGGSTFDAMLRRPELDLVEALAAPFNVGQHGAYQLAACPNLTRLEVLDLGSGSAIGNSGLEALAFSEHLPSLIELNVRGNEIGDVGVERLVASPLWRQLRRLDLSSNMLTAASVEYLIHAPEYVIEHLKLKNSPFGETARRRLTRHFGHRVELH